MLNDPNTYEVQLGDDRYPVKRFIWSSWSGIRYLNGREHHGPVLEFKTKKQYSGPRECSCRVCQGTVVPLMRLN